MRLNYTDVKWSEFRLTLECARALRATEVVTRYVFSFSYSEVLSASDFFYVEFTIPAAEICFTSDVVSLSCTAGVRDSAHPLDSFVVQASIPFSDAVSPVEVLSVTFRSPFAEVSLASDFISCSYCLVVRDSVGYNESFFFGGLFNVDVNNVAFVSDNLATDVDSPQPDVAAVSEFVRVGIRHMIDFYLGGFTIGSVVFGGRVR